jgi:hypothetical protein
MTGWPAQQASSAMTMRAGQLAQAAEHYGPGVAAGLRGAGAGMSSPSCIGTAGTKASADEALKAYTAGQRQKRAFTPSAGDAKTYGMTGTCSAVAGVVKRPGLSQRLATARPLRVGF